MTAPALKAYHESLNMVESHQVTLPHTQQAEFIRELRDQLTLKLAGLRDLETEEGENGLEFSTRH